MCYDAVTVVVMMLLFLCTAGASYILPVVVDFLLFHPSTAFVWVWVSFWTTH